MIVDSAYDMPGVSAKLNLVYVINNAGAVKVTQKPVSYTHLDVYKRQSLHWSRKRQWDMPYVPVTCIPVW